MSMKTLTLISLVLFSFSFTPFQLTEKLIGTWGGSVIENGVKDSATFIFNADGSCYMVVEDEKIGGSRFYDEDLGTWLSFTYRTDYSKTPHHLDFILTELETNTNISTMKCIFSIEKNKLKIAISDDEQIRPATFNDEDTVELYKVE